MSILDNIGHVLNLTQDGIELLSCFKVSVLSNVLKKYYQHRDIEDVFKWFFVNCCRRSGKAKKSIDWDKYNQIIKDRNITPDTKLSFKMVKALPNEDVGIVDLAHRIKILMSTDHFDSLIKVMDEETAIKIRDNQISSFLDKKLIHGIDDIFLEKYALDYIDTMRVRIEQ